MRYILMVGAAIAALPAASFADAPKLSQIIATIEDKGYEITDVDVGRRDIEIEARSADGMEWEIKIDPASGAILSEREDR